MAILKEKKNPKEMYGHLLISSSNASIYFKLGSLLIIKSTVINYETPSIIWILSSFFNYGL